MQLCRCMACAARGLNATDWYLLTQNAIRSRLTEKGWMGRLGWIAYHGTEQVPSKTPLLDGGAKMDFLYAPRPRGGTLHGPFTADHPVNRKYRDNLKSWQDWLKGQSYAGSRTVFEYYYDLVLLGPSTHGPGVSDPQARRDAGGHAFLPRTDSKVFSTAVRRLRRGGPIRSTVGSSSGCCGMWTSTCRPPERTFSRTTTARPLGRLAKSGKVSRRSCSNRPRKPRSKESNASRSLSTD